MTRRERKRRENDAARTWTGPYRSYDLVKEFTIAIGVVTALALLLTILFSSPDDPSSTVKSWSRTDPVDFVTTAVSELDGTSGTATYGPPYNHASSGQHMAFIYLQKWLGVDHPIDTAKDYVLLPLAAIPGQPALRAALTQYAGGSTKQQQAWSTAYANALSKAKAQSDGSVTIPAGNYGPVEPMMNSLLADAQSGGLDGQSWLWLYTFWYQIKPFSTSANADALVMAVMGVLSLAFILVPVLPGVSDLPRKIPIYKLIWRDHYRRLARG